MSITNPTNVARVAKMVETLGHLDKSARSNKATPEEVSALLGPVFDKLGAMGIASAVIAAKLPEEQPQPTPKATVNGLAKPQWVTVREMAEQADLKDLTTALAVYMNRLDEVLHDKT